jgi:hypothetical protein
LRRLLRAVFAFCGTQADSKTGAPFVNAAAWGRANNVLAEIIAG